MLRYLSVLSLLVFVCLAAQDARAAAYSYTYGRVDNEQIPVYSSSSTPTGVSPTAGATTAYTSNGTPTGIPPSVAATNGYGGYVSSSYIEPVDSRIYPVDSRIYPVDSRIYHSSSVITPVDSRIYPYSSVISHSSDNRTCPDIITPSCASDSILVSGGVDYNGCNLSPQCKYIGSGYRTVNTVTVYDDIPAIRRTVRVR